ncbi:MAG: hypothetical protein EZS28_010724, partial [Streblomastix strix]
MRRAESPTKGVQIPANQVQEMAPVFSIDQFVRFPSKRSKLEFGDSFKVYGLEWEILLGFSQEQYKDSISVKLNCLTLENCKTPYSKNILVRITVLSRNPKYHKRQSEYFTFSNEIESNGWNRFLDENVIFNPGQQFIQQDPRNPQQQGLNIHLEMLTEHISKHLQGTNLGYTPRNEIGKVGILNKGTPQQQVERKQMRFRLFTQQSVQLGAIDSLLSPGDRIFVKSRALPVKVKVDPKQTLFELREHIASATSIPSSKQRLWVMIERGTGNSSEENYWPCCLLEPLESTLGGRNSKEKHEQEQSEVALLFPEFKSRIFLEQLEQTDNLPTKMDPKPFIVAVWLFDKLSKKFSFLCITSVLPNFYSFEAILPTIQKSAGMIQSQVLQQMAMNGMINSETLQLFQISALTGRILQELQWQQDIHETVSNNDSKKDLEQPFHIVIQLRPTPEEFAADKTCNAFNYQYKKDNEISVQIIEILNNGDQQFPGEKISIDRDAFTEDLRKTISAKFHMHPQNIKLWRDKYSFYETGKFEKKTKIMTERVEVALNSTETVGILVNFSP